MVDFWNLVNICSLYKCVENPGSDGTKRLSSSSYELVLNNISCFMENLSSASKKVLGITNNSVMYRCHIHPNAYVPNIKDVVIFDYKAYNISDVTVYDNHFTLLCERLPIIPEGIS